MRNFKKVVALVLALAMVLSMNTVTFAAEMTAAEKAETLMLLKGDGNGVTAEYLAKVPTRLQAAIISLRLQGLETEALAFEGTETFTDAADVAWAGGQAVLAYLKANPAAGWMGYEDGSFMPNEPISAQAFVKVMLEALGYAQGTDFEWADVFTFAATVGLTALTADSAMTNDSLAVGMVDALAATNADGVVLLDALITAEAITEEAAIAAGLKEAAPAEFAVAGTISSNLKVVTVEFTSDVDSDTVTDANIDVKVGTTAQTLVAIADLNAANEVTAKAVDSTIQFIFNDTLAQSAEVTITLDGVKGKDGVELTDEDVVVTVSDKDDPEILSVVAENAKTIKVTYSEPIVYTAVTKVFSDVKIDDAKLVGKSSLSDDKTVVTFTLNNKLAANSYVFTMEKVVDFAGFVAPSEAKTITVVADDAAPVLVSTSVTNRDEIVLTFDENVASITSVSNGAVTDITDNKVTVDLTTPLVASDAFVSVTAKYSGVADVLGNKSADDIEFTFKADFDETAPTATVVVDSDGDIDVTFSEKVDAFTTADFTLVTNDSDETAIAATVNNGGDTDDMTFEIDITNNAVDEDEYKLTIKDTVLDLSVIQNKFAETSYVVTVPDKKKPTVTDTAYLVDTNTVRLAFSEAMDTATLTNASNYLFADGGGAVVGVSVATLDDVTITAGDDGKTVDITIGTKVTAGDKIYPLNLTDTSGTVLDPADYNVAVAVAAADLFDAADVLSIKLTATNEITIMLNDGGQGFAIADPNNFVLVDNGGTTLPAHYVTSAIIDSSDSDKIVLTLNDDLAANVGVAKADVNPVKLKVVAGDTKDQFNTALAFAPQAITDAVSPSISKVFEKTDDNSNIIVLEFDEHVAADAVAVEYDLKVMVQADTPYQLAVGEFTTAVVGENIEITPTKAGINEEVTVELLNGRYITDVSTNNTADEFAAMTVRNVGDSDDAVIDTKLPTFTASAVDASNTITVVFSEKVDAADAVLLANYTYTPDKAVPGTTENPTAAVLAADGLTVTLTVTTAVTSADGANDSIIDAIVDDLSGNTSASAPVEF